MYDLPLSVHYSAGGPSHIHAVFSSVVYWQFQRPSLA